MDKSSGALENLVNRSMKLNRSFWKNKRVLVTGHTGFKGSWLTHWLDRLGAQVFGFSLAPDESQNLLAQTVTNVCKASAIGDIRELGSIEKIFSQADPEIVFHLAAQALVRPSYEDPIGTFATNVMGTAHVLDLVRKSNSVRAVVNVTSDKCYENREWDWAYRESDPMGGHDPYSASKGCAELVTSAFYRSYFQNKAEFGLASARAGNVIGGADWSNDRLIPDCLRSLLLGEEILIRSPSSIRPWQHVLEPLFGYLLLCESVWASPQKHSRGYNFGPDASDARSVAWIADTLVTLWGGPASWRDVSDVQNVHEAKFLRLDSSLAGMNLGWKSCLDTRTALQWVIDWQRSYTKKDASSLVITHAQIAEYERLQELNCRI